MSGLHLSPLCSTSAMTALQHMPDAKVILRRAKSAIYPLLAKMSKNVDAEPRRYSRRRWRVADGASPKSSLYSPAKRPKCQKP